MRAAAACALTSLIGLQGSSIDSAVDLNINLEQIGLPLLRTLEDSSHTVRAEAIAALSPIVVLYQDSIIDAATK